MNETICNKIATWPASPYKNLRLPSQTNENRGSSDMRTGITLNNINPWNKRGNTMMEHMFL
jgi:hypothetical protein